jgi:hypothetical protein
MSMIEGKIEWLTCPDCGKKLGRVAEGAKGKIYLWCKFCQDEKEINLRDATKYIIQDTNECRTRFAQNKRYSVTGQEVIFDCEEANVHVSISREDLKQNRYVNKIFEATCKKHCYKFK